MEFILWLKTRRGRIVFILLLPLFVTAVTYFLTYRSGGNDTEALVSAGEVWQDSAEIRDLPSPRQLEALSQVALSEPILELLACRLLLHDLESPSPYRDTRELLSNYSPSMLEQIALHLKTKNEVLEGFSAEDASDIQVRRLLLLQRYDLKALRAHLRIVPIAESGRVKVIFSSENPGLSAFVVNTLSELLIRYLQKKDSETESGILFVESSFQPPFLSTLTNLNYSYPLWTS